MNILKSWLGPWINFASVIFSKMAEPRFYTSVAILCYTYSMSESNGILLKDRNGGQDQGFTINESAGCYLRWKVFAIWQPIFHQPTALIDKLNYNWIIDDWNEIGIGGAGAESRRRLRPTSHRIICLFDNYRLLGCPAAINRSNGHKYNCMTCRDQPIEWAQVQWFVLQRLTDRINTGPMVCPAHINRSNWHKTIGMSFID